MYIGGDKTQEEETPTNRVNQPRTTITLVPPDTRSDKHQCHIRCRSMEL